MKLSGKKTLLVAVALSTFFAAGLSYGVKNRWNSRMVTDAPPKAPTSTEGLTSTGVAEENKLACRTAVLSLSQYFSTPARWDMGQSRIPVPYLKSGIGMQVPCTSAEPKLLTDANLPVSQGVINIFCSDGALRIASSDCWGKTQAMVDAEAAAAAAEAARIAAEQAAAAEAARIAAAQAAAAEAARIAAEQAAAAAAAAAAYPVPACGGSCSDATTTYRYSTCTGKNTAGDYTIIYRNCNNGQKYITSSTSNNLNFDSGSCITALPAGC
jgi:hypothetical protein